MNDITLGIDIAKKKFDAVLLKDKKSNHKEFSNDKKGFEKLLSWLQKNKALQVHVCLEATGIYGEDPNIYTQCCKIINYKSLT